MSQNPFHLYEYMDDVAWFLAGYYMEAYNVFMSQIPEDSNLWDFVNDSPEDAMFVCDYVINEIMHQITPEGYRWGDKHEDDPTLGYWPWELS